MRNDDGDEIVDPGGYDLSGGESLRVYLTQDEDEEVRMWACTHCQEIDGTLNAILVSVLDGQMNLRQDADGQFRIRITEAGTDRVRSLINDLAQDDGGGDE